MIDNKILNYKQRKNKEVKSIVIYMGGDCNWEFHDNIEENTAKIVYDRIIKAIKNCEQFVVVKHNDDDYIKSDVIINMDFVSDITIEYYKD